MNLIDELIILFRERGTTSYFGEPVTQTEHGLQTASSAALDGASPALVVAALLHDVGHLLHHREDNVADRGVDARHEVIGAKWLSRFYGPEVTEPVRLHVAAKRYLCRVDPGYAARLLPASQQSLALQGGAFSSEEARAFELQERWEDAVRLRRWDDAAKIPGLNVEPLRGYEQALIAQLAAAERK